MNKIYRLYIDESGDHTYGKKDMKEIEIKAGGKIHLVKANDYPELNKLDKRYFYRP